VLAAVGVGLGRIPGEAVDKTLGHARSAIDVSARLAG
jgi:hypothetical protein